MSNWGNLSNQNGQDLPKRWKRLLDLPGNTEFYDLSTGKTYTRQRLKPLYKDNAPSVVDTFQDLMTQDEVFVNFIRVKRNGKLDLV